MNRSLLIFLFFANILDAIATDIGLRYGYIEEVNPLIAHVYTNSLMLYYIVKVGGVTLGILLLDKIFSSPATQKQKVLSVLLTSASAVYLVVLGIHAFWISLI